MKSIQRMIVLPTAFLLLLTAGCSNKIQEETKSQQESVKKDVKYNFVQVKTFKLDHIHGIGYPGNDQAFYIAAHDGLKIFKDSKWFETTTNHHDYMGFQALESGFMASGHPQKGLGLKDPLGIVQSTDKGETLKNMAFYGQADFHFMAASYSGSGVYVISEQPSDGLSPGVNYSKDNGATWKKSFFKDFAADSLGMIAVHPKNGDIMAMSTRSGIYYSTDNGNTMKLITDSLMVTALTFAGDSILFSSVENNRILLKAINPLTREVGNLSIPFLDYNNPITYLAVNPQSENQMAFATYKKDLFESIDSGKTWNSLLHNGKIEQE